MLEENEYKLESLVEMLQQARKQLSLASDAKYEPIAITGISLQVPGAKTLDDFWHNLCQGNKYFTSYPRDRYFEDSLETRKNVAGFIDNIFHFDPSFFDISKQEALYMDPQQRIMLKLAYNALKDAGYEDFSMLPERTAVIVGASSTDYSLITLSSSINPTPYSISGCSLNSIAGRIAFALGVHGPAFTIDSACSSSLLAIDNAVNLLRSKQIDMAIVGGINLLLCSNSTNALQKTNVISESGQCLPFSNHADGMLRGEGGGVIILMRQADAIKNSISAYANIIATASNQDGKSVQLTAPNGNAQEALLRTALANARTITENIAFIEAHGTGTKLGDPIELGALHQVYGKREFPLYIGSVKGNIGHLEAAAGIIGFIKATLVAYHSLIPPHINVEEATSAFDWNNSSLKIPQRLESLIILPENCRYTAVSSFGFSGTNAHAIIAPLNDKGTMRKNESKTLTFNEEPFKLELPTANKNYLNMVYQRVWKKVQVKKSFNFISKSLGKLIFYLPPQYNNLDNMATNLNKDSSILYYGEHEQIESLLSGVSVTSVIIFLPDISSEQFDLDFFFIIAEKLFNFLQVIAKLALKYKLQIFLFSLQANYILPTDKDGLLIGCLGSLIQSLRNENSSRPVLWIDVEAKSDFANVFAELELLLELPYQDLSYRNKNYYTSNLERKMGAQNNNLALYNGVYLITGGNGDIAQSLIEFLAKSGVTHIVTISRQVIQSTILNNIKINYPKCRIYSYKLDITDHSAFQNTIKKIEEEIGNIVAVYHLAGVIHDGLIISQNLSDFLTGLKAKIMGAWHCHELANLKEFVMFSSASTYLGGVGQSSYRLANTFLNQLAAYRQTKGLTATSIAWGAIKNTRSTQDDVVKKNFSKLGLGFMSSEQAYQCMLNILENKIVNAAVFEMDWKTFLKHNYLDDAKRYYFAEVLDINGSIVERKQEQKKIEQKPITLIMSALKKALPDTCNLEIDKNTPFESYGLNSLAAINLTDLLADAFNQPLSVDFLYSHPTINALLSYFNAENTNSVEYNTLENNQVSDEIAIIGINCRFPGNINEIDELWDGLFSGMSTIEINERKGWRSQLSQYTDADKYSYISNMGLLKDYDCFDADFFKISPREAEYMDPQHRIAIETAWNALEDANIKPNTEEKTNGGIFIGAGTSDFIQLLSNDKKLDEALLGTGSANSLLSGRIAYLLNWQGPTMVIDTACSSSLVAVYQACQALKAGECEVALAGGVNLILVPTTSLFLAKSNALSPSSKCASFANNADGYVRSEGCAFVVLKSLQQAQKNGDRIYAVIKGGSINHDGKSQGLTAPNGKAQEEVLKKALNSSQILPEQVGYIEAHGTGTPIGDPIEIKSINTVYGQTRNKDNPLYVGTLKANFGHMESAAGVAGLIKCALMLYYKKIVMQINLNAINSSCIVTNRNNEQVIFFPQQSFSWDSEQERITAVSSFGFSGTNAHIILREHVNTESVNTKKTNFIKKRFFIPEYSNYYIRYLKESFIFPDGHEAVQVPIKVDVPFSFSDHQLFGDIIIPGAAYIVLLCKRLLLKFANKTFAIRDITFTSPCILQNDSQGSIQISTSSSQFNCFTYLLGDEKPIKRCYGKYILDISMVDIKAVVDVFKAWHLKGTQGESAIWYYDFLKSQTISLGATFQCIQNIWYLNQIVICEVDLPDKDLTAGVFDSFFQTIGLCLLKHKELDAGVRVPIQIEEIKFYGSIENSCYTMTEMLGDSHGDFLSHNIHVFSKSGELMLSILNLQTKKISRNNLEKRFPEVAILDTYCWSWEELDLQQLATPATNFYKVVWNKYCKSSLANDVMTYYTSSFEDMEAIFKAKNELKQSVVCMIILPIAPTLELEHEVLSTFIEEVYAICRIGANYADNDLFQLNIISTNAFQVYSKESPQSLLAGVLYGCLKSLYLEYPQLSYKWDDLDNDSLTDYLICKAVDSKNSTRLFVHRDKKILTPKLLPYKWNGSPKLYDFSAVNCHVIIGATSKIAKTLITYLLNKGVRNIALIQRREIGLELGDNNILIYSGDYTQESSLVTIFNEIMSKQGNISTVYNCVGQLSDGLFIKQSVKQYASSITAKVQSSWAIHQVIKYYSQIHLVLFSSASAIFGGFGQGGYAGANQYLHGLAALRRYLSLPTTVIAWGDWNIGSKKTSYDHAMHLGIKPIDPDQAWDTLFCAMTESGTSNLPEAIFDIDWSIIANDKNIKSLLSSEFDHILLNNTILDTKVEPDNKAKLNSMTILERNAYIEAELTQLVQRILKLENNKVSVTAEFSDLGLESISAIELREGIYDLFSVMLPVANLFEKQTIQTLGKKIISLLELDPAIDVNKSKINSIKGDVPNAVMELMTLLEEDK